MIDKNLLRRADLLSGTVICCFGLAVVYQAMQMPMKDSWGGVQNVWYVSPALFPLFVGSMLSLLGIILVTIALKSIGGNGIGELVSYFRSGKVVVDLLAPMTFRFYAIVANLLVFVFILIPRVDFFLASSFFLLLFFLMFYLDGPRFLGTGFLFLGAATLLIPLAVSDHVGQMVAGVSEFPPDWLLLAFLAVLLGVIIKTARSVPDASIRLRHSLIIGIAAPLVIGVIFKYLLLVPLPKEGLTVWLLDLVWYADFWKN